MVKWLGVAGVALAVVAGVSLYVIGPGGDNRALACESPSDPESLRPFVTGEVAGVLLHDRPVAPPALRFQDENGVPVALDAWLGRAMVLNVWATWCPPCRHEMPALDALQAGEGDAGFEVVAVSIDAGDPLKPLAFLDEIDATNLAFYHDPSTGLFESLKASGRTIGLPVTLLIDSQGCEVGYMAGPADWASDDALALVRALKAMG